MDGLTRNRRGGRGPRRTPLSLGAGLRPLEPRLLLSADVLTYHNDNARDGANLKETILTPRNVNVNDFGKLGQVSLDGQVYAQPLVKRGVLIPGQGVHNVVYVATEHDSVYALDANTLKTLWHVSFIDPAAGVTTLPATSGTITPEYGITSTPVIDPKSATLYVVSTQQVTTAAGSTVVQQLHALSLNTGQEKFGGPVNLSATVPGDGAGSVNGELTYDASNQLQRSALLLSNGVVYIASSWLTDPYHGFLLGYDAHTLKQVSAFVDSPDATLGAAGIWMSGDGPAADSQGNIYVTTGNGDFNPNTPDGGDFGDSVLKFAAGAGVHQVSDYFTPDNQQYLNDQDKDLGSGGVMLLPDQPGPNPHLLVQAGKLGEVYLVNRDNLGQYSSVTNTSVQSLPGALDGLFSTPAYFNGTVYFGNVNAPLTAYTLVNGQFNAAPAVAPSVFGWPGATPSVSANGKRNGIVWTVDGSDLGGPGVLRAYAANNIADELYNSAQAGTLDQSGTYNKYSPPTVANGKVYVAGKGSLTLYGLLPAATRVEQGRAAVIKQS